MRLLAGSALAHTAALAVLLALVAQGSGTRQEVLEVFLITVEERAAAPAPVPLPLAAGRPAATAARARRAREASLAVETPAPPAPGAPGPDGAGKASLPASPRPEDSPLPSPAQRDGSGEGASEAAASPPAPMAASPRQDGLAAVHPAEPPPRPDPRPPEAPREAAPDGTAAGPLDVPLPKALVAETPAPGRLYPAAAGGVVRAGSGSHEAALGVSAGGKATGAGRSPLGDGSGAGGSGPGAGRGRGTGVGRGGDGAASGRGGGGSSQGAGLADLLGQIRRRIEAAKRYPDEARRDGVEGSVTVRFRVRADGQVEVAEIARSSGSRALDAASLETIRRAAPFPPVRGWVQVPLAYTLSEADR